MKLRSLTILAILSMSTQSWALFNKVQKYEVKSNHAILDGYEQDGEIYLYAEEGTQRLQKAEVISSVDSIDGVQVKDTVLIRTKLSAQVACTVEAVFENKDIDMFCDETQTVKSPKGYGVPTIQENVRNHYVQQSNTVEKDMVSLSGLSKDQVVELKATTEKFKVGEKVRITHIYVSGFAVIEHSYKKDAPSVLPDYQELVLIDLLK